MGFKQDSHLLSDVSDVHEVISWAEENAAGRTFVVYAAFTVDGEGGILRVHGTDPTHN